MKRTLAILFIAAPVVAGAIAALGTRHDMRIMWMALAATVAAQLVVAVMPAPRGRAVVAVTALLVATVAAALVAVSFGARGVAGVGAVAVVLAGFATAGAVLGRRVAA